MPTQPDRWESIALALANNALGRSPSQGEPNLKTRVTGFGINLNISPVLLHNSLDGVQAEARAFPNSFGCEKRLKDVRLHLAGNSWAIVANLNYNATVVLVGSDAQLAFCVHCVNRVVNDVGPDLVELAAKRIHQQRNALVIALHHHSLLQLMIQDREGGFQAPYYVYVLHGGLVHVGVFLDCAHQVRYAGGAALD